MQTMKVSFLEWFEEGHQYGVRIRELRRGAVLHVSLLSPEGAFFVRLDAKPKATSGLWRRQIERVLALLEFCKYHERIRSLAAEALQYAKDLRDMKDSCEIYVSDEDALCAYRTLREVLHARREVHRAGSCS